MFVKQSKTKWEVSEFGGYKNLIFDHPYVEAGWDVNFSIPENKELYTYQATKLMKIFLLFVKKNGLISNLCKSATVEIEKSFLGTKKVAVIASGAKSDTLRNLISKEVEYGPLFNHYAALIRSAKITVDLPENKEQKGSGGKGKEDEKKKNQKGGGQGEGQGEKDDKKDEKNNGKGSGKDNRQENQKSRPAGPPQFANRNEIQELEEELNKTKANEFRGLPPLSRSSGVSFLHMAEGGKTRFTDKMRIDAGRLLQMLDISFDPTSDRINSLRNGKLDTRKIAEVKPGNLNVYYKVEENVSTKPFSVCILVDESGSMGGTKIDLSIELVKTLYLAFSELLPPDKLFIYGHSTGRGTEVYVYQDKYNNKFEERIAYMCSRGSNHDASVIEAVYNKVRTFTDDNIIFLILSDGAPCEPVEMVRKVVEKCRRDNFVTIGIGIEYFGVEMYDYSCVVKSRGTNMVDKTTRIINKAVKMEFQ